MTRNHTIVAIAAEVRPAVGVHVASIERKLNEGKTRSDIELKENEARRSELNEGFNKLISMR